MLTLRLVSKRCNLTSDKEYYVNFHGIENTQPPFVSLPSLGILANLRRFALADGFLVAETYTSIAINFQNLY